MEVGSALRGEHAHARLDLNVTGEISIILAVPPVKPSLR